MRCNLLIEYSETSVNGFWPYHDIVLPFTMIYYVVDGFARYKINGRYYEFQPKHIYFFPPNVPISLLNDLSPDFKIMYVHVMLTPEIQTLIDIDTTKDKFLCDIIRLMRANILDENTIYTRHSCELLVSYISEKYNNSSLSVCNKIKNYIKDNYVEVYRNSDLSEVFNYSNSHIIKMYKDAFNTTPRQYALSCMLEQIISRLLNDEPIYKISDSLEFSSPENFSKFFKKQLGVSPSYFVKKNKKNIIRKI